MNTLLNDKGEYVCAVGSPNSMARIKRQYPMLIERLHTIKNSHVGGNVDIAINECLRDAEVPTWLFGTFYEIVELV